MTQSQGWRICWEKNKATLPRNPQEITYQFDTEFNWSLKGIISNLYSFESLNKSPGGRQIYEESVRFIHLLVRKYSQIHIFHMSVLCQLLSSNNAKQMQKSIYFIGCQNDILPFSQTPRKPQRKPRNELESGLREFYISKLWYVIPASPLKSQKVGAGSAT